MDSRRDYIRYKERLEELGLFSLKKSVLRMAGAGGGGNKLIAVLNYIKGGYKENGASLFPEVHHRIQGNRYNCSKRNINEL